MPKSAKKRREKAADFSKAKLKLGKGKQLAPNAIDTSFKARSIALPSQSITHEKDGNTPTTKRRLTFDDLVTDTKHYSASTRRDAILGLRELLEANWHLVKSSLTTLINTCARLIGDEDVIVRKALLAFFAWLLPRIPHGDLMPHSTLLLLFVTFAQTHIFPEIRIDAVRFLDLFLEYIPRAVTTGWNENKADHGRRILEGYLGLLNANTKFLEKNGSLSATANTSVTLTPASKLVVLRSLSTFFRISLSSLLGPSSSSADLAESSTFSHTWFLSSSFHRPEDYYSFEELFQPSVASLGIRKFKAEVEAEEEDDFICAPSAGLITGTQFTLQEVTDISNTIGLSDSDNSDVSGIRLTVLLAQTLHTTLIATFLDCAPTVFSPSTSPPETEVQLVLAIGQIVRNLYGVILQAPVPVKTTRGSASEDLGSILGHMSPYFPFTPARTRDIKVEQAFQDLNLIFCELSSLFALTAQALSTCGARHVKTPKVDYGAMSAGGLHKAAFTHAERVSEYILQLLRGTPVSDSQLGRALTPASYLTLLPAIWALINNTSASHREISSTVLHAIVDHSIKTSHKSSLKRLTIEFVARLLLISTEPAYRGNFSIERDSNGEKFAEWIAHLPQPLWEFGSSDLVGSQAILTILLRVYQRKSRVLQAPKTVSTLRSKLVPYFSMTHSVRGRLSGPYSKLPVASPSRRLALDVAATLLSGKIEQDGLRVAVDLAVAGTEESGYWAQIQHALVAM